MNAKLHAICDSQERPRSPFLTAGRVSDDTGAAALLATVPVARALLADRGHGAAGRAKPSPPRGAYLTGFDIAMT